MASDLPLADTLWTRGAGHLIGAQALVKASYEFAEFIDADDVDQVVFNGKYSASLHLLIGFAAELLLKSAYILADGDPRHLGPRGIGHDLVAALEAAQGQGFTFAAPNLKWVMEHLREPHLQHQFRYGGAESLHLPELKPTFATLEFLAGETQAELRSQLGMRD